MYFQELYQRVLKTCLGNFDLVCSVKLYSISRIFHTLKCCSLFE